MMISDSCVLRNEIRSAAPSPRVRLGAQITYDITEEKAVRETPESCFTHMSYNHH